MCQARVIERLQRTGHPPGGRKWMLELAGSLLPRLDAGHSLAVATVTRINGSAPRTLGTAMALDDEGAVIGSISGGCVEGAVYEACLEVLHTGVAIRHEFGYSDDD